MSALVRRQHDARSSAADATTYDMPIPTARMFLRIQAFHTRSVTPTHPVLKKATHRTRPQEHLRIPHLTCRWPSTDVGAPTAEPYNELPTAYIRLEYLSLTCVSSCFIRERNCGVGA